MSEIEFSYEGHDGPLHWNEMFSNANGLNQSPIDILNDVAEYHSYLTHNHFRIYYEENMKIKNTGHSFQIFFDHENDSYVVGGPVKKKHKFLQMHIHWGIDDSKGSEHSVDGSFYSAEIHFVNWNYHQYKTSQEAMSSNNHDGLLVLGVFVEIGKPNPDLNKIISHFKNIHLKGEIDNLNETIYWEKLFPADLSKFYTYRGSLTTPPLSECVRWVVFRDPIQLSEDQLNELRTLSTSKCKETHMMCNDRPTCELHHRKVYKSFH